MEHVVFYPGPDGAPAFRRLASLDDAVRFAEHLRNVEGVNELSVHALTEVPVAFRAYYRAEVPGDVAGPAPVLDGLPLEREAPPAEPVAAPLGDVAAVAEAPVVPAARADEPVETGRRGLGFFAH